MKKETKIYLKSLSIFIFFSWIFIILISLGYTDIAKENVTDRIKYRELNQVQITSNAINMKLQDLNNDMAILKYNIDSKLETVQYQINNQLFINEISEIFYGFSNTKKIFEQIRLLDTIGMEIIRVDFKNHSAEIIPKQKLQNKSDRYYFYETQELLINHIYVSRFDLNIENGEIENPIKPMLRFVIPIFDADSNRILSFIINIKGQDMINDFAQMRQKDNELMMIDYDGYWLHNADSSKCWQFMYKNNNNITFKNEYPGVFKKILNHGTTNQVVTNDGIFTFKFFGLDTTKFITSLKCEYQGLHPLRYIIISHIPEENFEIYTGEIYKLIRINSFFFLLISLLIALYYARNQRKKYLNRIEIINAKEYAEKANKSKDKLFATVSHDMKNIAALQLSYSELLSNNLGSMDTDSLKNFVKQLYDVSKSSAELLENLLFWSRSQMDKIILNPTACLLFDVVYATVSVLEHNAKAKDIQLVNNIENDILMYGDIDLLKLIIRNIISNSIKFSNEDSKILIEATEKNGFIYCSIIDEGVGISEENISRILDTDSYYTSIGTNSEKGTGFGMNMCINFVQLHYGIFSIESEVGVGSKFTFSIPMNEMTFLNADS